MDCINLEDEKDVHTSNTTGNKFSVGYSKRGTAKCIVCKKTIGKGEIQIGKSVPTTRIVQYRHVECAFSAFRRARALGNVITSIEELNGINEINDIDMTRLNTNCSNREFSKKAVK